MNELISVIIPCQNDAETLRTTVQSIQEQQSVNVEIIIVCDGATQDTLHIAQDLAKENIQVLQQEAQGAPAARNAGARLSKGAYLYFCDADVKLAPNALHTLLTALQKNTEAAFAYGGFVFDERPMPAVHFSPYWLQRLNFISTMSLIRRAHFPGFDTHLKRFQDWDLWLSVVEKGGRGVAVAPQLFQTLAHQRSAISTRSELRAEAKAYLSQKHQLPKGGALKNLVWKISFTIYRLLHPVR